jgi:hypothetical protein
MQQWIYDPVNLTLRVAGLSNKCLDWDKKHNNAIMYGCHNRNNQKWTWDHELGFLKSYDDKAKCVYFSNRSNSLSEKARRLEVATCNRAMNNFGLSFDKVCDVICSFSTEINSWKLIEQYPAQLSHFIFLVNYSSGMFQYIYMVQTRKSAYKLHQTTYPRVYVPVQTLNFGCTTLSTKQLSTR